MNASRTCFVLTCFSLMAVAFFSTAEYIDFHPEESCSSQGGICVLSSDCPNSKLAKGLCPQQQAQGAECCHKIPDSDKRCASHGGECINNCPPRITHEDLECPSGTACCIWLK